VEEEAAGRTGSSFDVRRASYGHSVKEEKERELARSLLDTCTSSLQAIVNKLNYLHPPFSPCQGQSSLVREHVLALIQTWAAAFRSDPTMVAISNLYQDLLLKHVEFPAQVCRHFLR
jgi:hypothetical protein